MQYLLEADYHTHTIFSKHKHGKDTPEANIKAAIAKGLKTIGISDHGPAHALFGIKDMSVYLETLRKLQQKYAAQIVVSIGVELNFIGLDGRIDLSEAYADAFDTRILGFHQCVLPNSFASGIAFYGQRILAKNSRSMITKATDMYIRALEKYPVTILAHPGHAISLDFVPLADACKTFGTYVEINNTHGGLCVKDIARMADRGAKFVLSSDAHRSENVGEVSIAHARMLAAGLSEKEVVNIKKGE